MPFETFNGDARRALILHEKVLTADNMDFLRSLPATTKVRGEVTLAHGSPRDTLWEYILNTLSARLNFDHFDTPWCFIGHSHIQCMFVLEEGSNRITLGTPVLNQRTAMKPRMILNPGSVGQPRDRDPRAAYAIYDSEAHTWEARRVDYNIAEVQQRIRESGLPEKHAVRIAEGW
jgi:diadenosine tetraphosphatase ApaH/serine/threonine PP2A family protein phosphatase